MGINEILKKIFDGTDKKICLINSGLYHYIRESDGKFTRFHLRVDLDGSGMLLVNSTIGARLTETGVIIAKSILDGEDNTQTLNKLKNCFNISDLTTVQKDIDKIKDIISNLASPEDNYPIINLNDTAVSPYESQLIAPLSADVSYGHKEKMLQIVDALWKVGIPHVKFLITEKTFDKDLIQLIEHAEDIGMITGICSNAQLFDNNDMIKKIAAAGLDHFTFYFASADRKINDSIYGYKDYDAVINLISQLKEFEVCPVASIPLIEDTVDTLFETIEMLNGHGIYNISFYAIAAPNNFNNDEKSRSLKADSLPQVAAQIEEFLGNTPSRFLWNPSVLRNPKMTIIEQVNKGPRCSGDVSVRIEKDGSVIPPRGIYQIAGNILNDSWEKIWNNDVFKIYREHIEAPTRCEMCPGLTICAADCPRNPEGWAS